MQGHQQSIGKRNNELGLQLNCYIGSRIGWCKLASSAAPNFDRILLPPKKNGVKKTGSCRPMKISRQYCSLIYFSLFRSKMSREFWVHFYSRPACNAPRLLAVQNIVRVLIAVVYQHNWSIVKTLEQSKAWKEMKETNCFLLLGGKVAYYIRLYSIIQYDIR